MLKKLSIVIIIIFGPIFIKLLKFGENNVVTVLSLIAIYCIIYIFINTRDLYLLKQFQPFIFYFKSFAILIFAGFLFDKYDLQVAIYRIYPCIIPIYLFLFLSREFELNNTKIINKISEIIFVFFIIQLLLSLYESYLGYFIAAGFDIRNDPFYNTWQDRIVLNIFSQYIPPFRIFKIPLSGLLGQHNYYGAQLPFYNLIFLLQYYLTKSNKYLLASFLTLFAVTLNTSRFGLGAIIVSILVYFIFVKKRNTSISKSKIITLTVLFIFLINMTVLISGFNNYLYKTDSLSYRTDNYYAANNYINRLNLVDFTFGQSSRSVEKLFVELRGFAGNLESDLLYSFFYFGIIGLLVLLVFWIRMLISGIKKKSNQGMFIILLLINIIAVSLTVNGILQFFITPLVSFLFFMIIKVRMPIEN